MHDFQSALQRNAFSLIDGKRMIRGLEFDRRPNAVITQMYCRFQMHGVGIKRQARAEPAKKRTYMASLGDFVIVLRVALKLLETSW